MRSLPPEGALSGFGRPGATDMQLTLWTYEGPPHIGAMRIATAMRGLHYVLHAPQGDTYADLLFTMIERSKARPPSRNCHGRRRPDDGLRNSRQAWRSTSAGRLGAPALRR